MSEQEVLEFANINGYSLIAKIRQEENELGTILKEKNNTSLEDIYEKVMLDYSKNIIKQIFLDYDSSINDETKRKLERFIDSNGCIEFLDKEKFPQTSKTGKTPSAFAHNEKGTVVFPKYDNSEDIIKFIRKQKQFLIHEIFHIVTKNNLGKEMNIEYGIEYKKGMLFNEALVEKSARDFATKHNFLYHPVVSYIPYVKSLETFMQMYNISDNSQMFNIDFDKIISIASPEEIKKYYELEDIDIRKKLNVNSSNSSEQSNDEQLMLDNLEKAMNSEFTMEMLKRNWNKYHNIHYIGNLIGEIYTLHMINKDGSGFEYYMTQMELLYSQYKERQISPENFDLQKSKFISIVIAAKMGIDINKKVTQEDMIKVKNYFLQEYVANGYVTHSFPEAYIDSIMSDGLIGTTAERKDKPNEIQEIQDLFMSKGIAAPLGGYPYYEGSGIYFEHDFTKTFQHSIDSPEWFTWFTSSDHTTAYHSDVNNSPYVLRDELYCRRNINDLCQNAELNTEETKKVVDFYTTTYDKYSSSKLNVALIPKKILGKSDISKAVSPELDLLSSITYVLKDGAKQYVEHQGNVYHGTIPSNEFKISVIPSASKYINAEQYSRETKEHLLNPESNLAILKNAENNKNRMSFGMQEKVELLKSKLEIKNSKEVKANKKVFDQRSQSEIQVAKQIKEKNMAIKQQKEAQLSLDKPKVKTLTKSPNNGNGSSPSSGFVDTLVITLITGFIAGALFMLVYSLIK